MAVVKNKFIIEENNNKVLWPFKTSSWKYGFILEEPKIINIPSIKLYELIKESRKGCIGPFQTQTVLYCVNIYNNLYFNYANIIKMIPFAALYNIQKVILNIL